MAIIVRPRHRGYFTSALDQMHRLRRRVFVEQLGWTLPAGDGVREVDEFDSGPCQYLLGLDEGGHLVASLRLTPSEAPNVTCEVLGPQLGCVFPRERDTVECSRECYDPDLEPAAQRAALADLYASLAELYRREGWTRAIGVAYERRVLLWVRSGAQIEILGGPYMFAGDREASFAIRWSQDRARPGAMASHLGEGMLRLQDPDEDASLLTLFAERRRA